MSKNYKFICYECDECGADFDQFELAELEGGEYLTFVK